MFIVFLCFDVLFKGFGKSDTPGPCHFIDPTITRKGKDGTPSYSLYGRHKDLSEWEFNCNFISSYLNISHCQVEEIYGNTMLWYKLHSNT